MLHTNSPSKFGPLIRLYVVLERAHAIINEEHTNTLRFSPRTSDTFPYILSMLKLASDDLFDRCVMITDMISSEETTTTVDKIEKLRFELLSHAGTTEDIPDTEVARLQALVEAFQSELNTTARQPGADIQRSAKTQTRAGHRGKRTRQRKV